MVIVSCWESPTNEGTESYTLKFMKGASIGFRTWIVGEIKINGGDPENGWPPTVDVHDFDGNLRVELPVISTAVEYGPSPWLEN